MNKKGFNSALFVLLIPVFYFGCSTNSKIISKTDAKATLEETYKGKVVIIVNGDDFGVTEIFTDATLDAYLKKGISSASIIANGHDAERAIRLLKEHPELTVGMHLTLTGDWKPLTAGTSLRDTNGLMWNTAAEAGRNVTPAEAEAEWEAQIRKVMDAGITVTHLDSHMGCYFATDELYMAAYNLAKKYGIPMISPFMEGRMPLAEKKFFPLSSYTGIYRLMNQEETLANRSAAYWEMLGEFKPGIHYIFSHHGWEPPDKKITGDLDLRINDYKFWTSEKTKKELAEKGYIVISCTPLKEEFQSKLK